jgi:hypothetical protein
MTSWAKEDDYRRQAHYTVSLMQLYCKRGLKLVAVLYASSFGRIVLRFNGFPLSVPHSSHQWLPEIFDHSRADGRHIFRYVKQ